MKYISCIFLIGSILFFVSCSSTDRKSDSIQSKNSTTSTGDPLPSWNDGQLKKDIVDYVARVTKEGSTYFIPVENRVETFDNDGTLWAEKPYVQELFAFYQVKKMVEANPALAKKQPFKAVIEHDKVFFEEGGDKALIQLIGANHTGMTEEEFEWSANDFANTVKYPGRNVSLKEITYQPQIELLNYSRANGFKTFICTGGTIEFVRSISSQLYGIPKDQVIGTTFNYKFGDSSNQVLRTPELEIFNDKINKPVGIQEHFMPCIPNFDGCNSCSDEDDITGLLRWGYQDANSYNSSQICL